MFMSPTLLFLIVFLHQPVFGKSANEVCVYMYLVQKFSATINSFNEKNVQKKIIQTC